MTEMAYHAPPSVDDAEISRQRLATRAAKPLQWFLKLLPGIALLLFWQWASGRLIKEIYVSKPTAVAQRLCELFASGEIYPHLWTTGQELVLGYVIGVAGGVIGGYALGRSPRLARIFGPYVMAFYGVPKIALAPLFIIWFGIGMGSKIALASIMVFSWSSTMCSPAYAASTVSLSISHLSWVQTSVSSLTTCFCRPPLRS